MADRYFKRPNGDVLLATPNLDIKSLEDRFEEVDKNGKKLTKKVPKKKAAKAKGTK